MEVEKIETKSVVKPGKNLQTFIKENETEANKKGKDPQVETLRALTKARNTGQLEKIIKSDIENIGDISPSDN